MKSYNFLFWAYNIVWAGLAFYLILLGRRLERAMGRLRRAEESQKR